MADIADAALLRVLQLASPALPIGGYAYSQGLEYAIEQDWVTDLDSAAAWLTALAELRLMKSLEVPSAMAWRTGEPLALISAFAMAGQHWHTGPNPLALGVLWSWLENQTGAATKLIPLGQTDAQRLLDRLLPALPPIVEQAAGLADEELGAGLPGLAFASARHEQQYTRLFRS